MDPKERAFLIEAKKYLEKPSWVIRLTNKLGKPIQFALAQLPVKTQEMVSSATVSALTKAFEVSLRSVPSKKSAQDRTFGETLKSSTFSKWQHTGAAATTGAIAGFFGALTLPIELPITTGIMLRSIIQAGENFGFNTSTPEFKTECMYVFTLGTTSKADDEIDSAYYTSRAGLQTAMNQAAEFIALHSAQHVKDSVKSGTAPAILNLIGSVARIFEVTVTEKMLAEALPVVGAVGGASVNAAFAQHFAKAAHFHFGIKHLERKYKMETIKAEYTKVS